MVNMTPKERVLAALRKEELDRPPVAVFTQSATIGQMEALGVYWPEAHSNAEMMAKLGAGQAEILGFEAVRAPFCLTAEVEALGARVDPGRKDRTPMLKEHPFKMDPMAEEFDEPNLLSPEEFLKTGRPAVVLKAIELLAERYGDKYPVVAGNTGPFTIAGHLVNTENLVFGILMAPDEVKKWVKAATVICKAYSQALSDAGADVIQMSEPSASTDLLSPDMFNEYVGGYVHESLATVKGAFSCLHICGDTYPILDSMIATGVSALSIEEKVEPKKAVEKVAGRAALVGNVGVVRPLLQGTPDDCAKQGKIVAEAGFNVVSPGCGLSAMISNDNLLALVKAIKG
ncbi:MAG: [methyl-Co(III) methanol/glycine betaine-specific corrinoid protein]:coenzyme methyltransferase [Candidatus Methanomethylophilaceae archaeon]|nr:[methyl-Co(III) methanol/glycine betaine-specific corrinoid protein]:coenzyme methyltransferase [Candidatus Methanomethylophilaceae archaeon]MDI3541823.1 [methyl-Co(III) methanol/glycine betaine-specific corrinoid protein]:coenzyme methyltransferase [Candidatus Methanomethylophilaceae archaeon]